MSTSTKRKARGVLVNGSESGSIEFGYHTAKVKKGAEQQIEIYKATADGEWQLTGSQVVVDTDSVVVAIEKKPTQALAARLQKLDKRYRKIAADGTVLDINAGRWRCVLDTQTQLIWEVKTDDSGLHDKDKRYRWGGKGVSPELSDYLGNNRRQEEAWDGSGKLYNQWNVLVDGTNQEQLCGYTDWRVPDLHELASLVHCSQGSWGLNTGCTGNQYQRPTGHRELFPHLQSTRYWSSSPFWLASYAWIVNFHTGDDDNSKRDNNRAVRLVRGGQ